MSQERKVKRMGKVYDSVMGLILGDALGVPVEFKKRDTFTVTDMIGYGTYSQPPGTWSDDSSLTLATMESIIQFPGGEIVPEHMMLKFSKWLDKGEFTPYGEVFDVGGTTEMAIRRFNAGVEPLKCGLKHYKHNGNGSLMRILPLALMPSSVNDIDNVSCLTHAHEISKRACRMYVATAEQLLKGKTLEYCLKYSLAYFGEWAKEFSRLPQIPGLGRDEIRSTGYVVDTLEAALWCIYHTSSYRDCVLKAVNLGGDTDTIAAVAGGLAGIIYGCGGECGIPDEWIAQIARKDWIFDLCERFETVQAGTR